MSDISLQEIGDGLKKLTNMVTNLAKRPAKIFTVSTAIPELKDGERYVGVIISACGNVRKHIILLPGYNDDASWQKQMEWATSIGGELPDRVESALLFATMKDEFKEAWYWLREQHASYGDYAWVQGFGSGGQDYFRKDGHFRARAVRSIPIE